MTRGRSAPPLAARGRAIKSGGRRTAWQLTSGAACGDVGYVAGGEGGGAGGAGAGRAGGGRR